MRSVAAAAHTLALDFAGRVWAWGFNAYGQVGDGTRTDRLRPVRLEGLERVVDVGAGLMHSLASDADGNLFSWGRGDGCGHDSWRETQPRRVDALDQHRVVDVAAGWNFSVVAADLNRRAAGGGARNSTGAVLAFGDNSMGQLGCGNTASRAEPQGVSLDTGLQGLG